MLSVDDRLSDENAIGIGRKGTIDKPQLLKAPFWTVDTLFYMTTKEDYDLHFCYSLINTIRWKKYDESTGVPSLSKTSIDRININIPIINEEQNKIGRIFRQLDNTIALHQDKLDKLNQLKKGYLQIMFPQNDEVAPKLRFINFKLDWEQHKLGEHCVIKTGGTPKTSISEYWLPKEIPWMSSGEVNKKRLLGTDNKISKKGLDSSSARWVKEKSILIALAGQGKTRGTVAINEVPLTTNQSIAAIEVNSSLDSEFVFQNLESRYEELRMISSGDGTRGGLNKQIIAELKILAPSAEEQNKIGKLYKNLDDTIALHQTKLEKLDALKMSFLQKMFI